MIARLYAMYQGSIIMLVFLVLIFLAINIACVVIMGTILKDTVSEELILSGTFVGVSCFQLALLSPQLENSTYTGAWIISDAFQNLAGVQMFVLGPRLILSVREYHAKLVVDSDAEASMNSIVFQERVDVPTSSIM
ncbi:uncharacterized protein HD556DRAFT_1444497 [Suillus plorans]|uniref:Uncharacterized protein n=1 Tax=Suillus plorans TaxID=116603 RepID=A0A9P7AMI5_9AGAM|nr:uncharacterized protein HD556DRAFT_1444497 [Suillus plorans]KAG1792499.1 hypothetical protein HD556DRAFT_1444497 [Suillus plorans]